MADCPEADCKNGLNDLVCKTFYSSDENKKGYLSQEDYKVSIIRLFGYKPSKYELAKVWSEKGNEKGQEDGLDLDQFKKLVLPRLKQRDPSEHIRQIFLAFDRFCHGFISLDDCKAAFRKVLPHMTEERIEMFFKEIDSDLDGRVSFRDFEMMMKSIIL